MPRGNRFAKHKRPSARALNDLVDNEIRSMHGANGVQVSEVAGKRVVNLRRPRVHPFQVVLKRFMVVSEADDYLTCYAYNAIGKATVQEDVLVAKPYELRREPFDNNVVIYPDTPDDLTVGYVYSNSYTRLAAAGWDSVTETYDTEETQIMTPRYFIGCQIVAARGISGCVGVEVNDQQLVWEDINNAGRFWAVTG